MEKQEPVPPTKVPETAATYERTKQNADAKPADMSKSGVATSTDAQNTPMPTGGKVAGDMKTEVPTGWDQAPNDIQADERKRHPRPDGVGGSDPNNTNQSERRASELGG